MGRNGNGVTEASGSSYEIAFTYRGVRCRERIKLKPSPANRKRVEHHLGAIIDAIYKGSFNYSETFPDSPRRFQFLERQGEALLAETYFDDWLEYKARHLKASTLQGYIKTINNQIIPQFIGKPIADIKRTDIKLWLSAMKCTNKRLANIQSVLRTALQDAVMDELIETNPLYGWSYQTKDAPKKANDVDPFNAEEQQAIINELTGQARNLIQFNFWTGMRPSEVIALEWDDIDWRRGVIIVNKALTQAASEAESPKTNAGKREVKILKPAMDALIDQKQFTLLKNKEIFQNPRTNERWSGDQAIRKTLWAPTLKKAKVRYRRPYQTRHTYASMMLTAGESIAWLANQMGHADWGMLRTIYARFIKDSIPDAGNKAVEMFARKSYQANKILINDE